MTSYWFFDSALKGRTSGAKVIPGKLHKDDRNPLMVDGAIDQPAAPWELLIGNGYPNVFYDPLQRCYRCYYTAYISNRDHQLAQAYKAKEERVTGILYAESQDGIHWVRPSLGIITVEGSKDNNVVAVNTHGAGVLLDLAESDPAKRYKMISRDDRGPLNIHAAFSADGIHFEGWTPVIDDPLMPGDSHNYAIRDPKTGKYYLYTRSFTRALRMEVRAESDDFLHWSHMRPVLMGLDADDQVYGMPVFLQDGLYWGLAEIFYTGDEAAAHFDHVEVELCYSGDGLRWQRVAPGQPFIPNGPESTYDYGICYASVPVQDGLDWRFYYMGGSGTHYHLKETGLCLGTIPRNRLAGVTAVGDGEFMYQTRKLRLLGLPMTICADVAAGGRVTYELLDAKGQTIPGFGQDQCVPITVSSNRAELRWPNMVLPDEPCMLRFTAHHATLYNITGDMQLTPAHPL